MSCVNILPTYDYPEQIKCTRKVLFEKFRPKKLKFEWTYEMAQDIMAFQMLDVQREMESILMRQMIDSMSKDIDKQILETILNTNAHSRI